MPPTKPAGAASTSVPPSSSDSSKRISIACETCRIRKRRCDGNRPCGVCIKYGFAQTCRSRAKARPKRPSSAYLNQLANEPQGVQSETAASPSFPRGTNLSEQVEQTINQWLTDQDLPRMDLSLPDLNLPPDLPLRTPIPEHPYQWAETLDTCFTRVKHALKSLPEGRANHLIEAFKHSPGALEPDELALVLALLACGRQVEFRLIGQEGKMGQSKQVGSRDDYWVRERDVMMEVSETRVDYVYFQLALRTLDDWNQTSITALGALHALHLFIHHHGGRVETEDILMRISAQCRLLGIHRNSTAVIYPPEERVGLLFYLSLYKDTWFSTLVGRRPAFAPGEYDQTWLLLPDFDQLDLYETGPHLVSLTLIENKIMQLVSSHTPHRVPPATSLASTEGDAEGVDEQREDMDDIEAGDGRTMKTILEAGRELTDWQRPSRDVEVDPPSTCFATIRSQWLRMVIHFPLSIHPDNPFPNLTVVARAACLILDTYTQISHSILFIPKWSETRRIITATQLLIVCWVRGEMDKTEMKRYAERGVCLLYRASGGFEPAEKVLRDMIKLLEAAGLEKSEVVGWTKQGEIEGEDVRIGVGQSRGGEGVIPPFDFTLPS